MKKHRSTLKWVLGGGLVTSLAVWACSFPDVDYANGVDSGNLDAPIGQPPVDGGNPVDGDPNANVDPEGGAHDAMVRDPDAGRPIRPDASADGEAGAVGCSFTSGGSTCNCDGDPVGNNGSSCPPAVPKTDCDDFDRYVFPGQDFVVGTWDDRSPALKNDYNCDGTVTYQYSRGVGCAVLANCGQGFASAAIACGESGTFNVCNPLLDLAGNPVACLGVKSTRTEKMGCK